MKKDAKVLRQVATSLELGSPTSPQPSYQQDDMSAMLSSLKVPITTRRSKSPTLLPWSRKKKEKKEENKKKNVTLNPRITALKSTGGDNPSERVSSLSYHKILLGLDPEHMISSPVHRTTDPTPVTLRDTPILRRVNAFKRTSVLDIVDINQLSYDVSNQTHKLLML